MQTVSLRSKIAQVLLILMHQLTLTVVSWCINDQYNLVIDVGYN